MKKITKLNAIALTFALLGGAVAIQAAHAGPAPLAFSPPSLPAQFTLPGGVQCHTRTNIVGRVYGVDCGSSSLFGLRVQPAPDAPALPPGVAAAGGERAQPIQVRCNFDAQTCHGGGHVFLEIPRTAPASVVSAASAEHGRVRYVLDCNAAPVHGALDCNVSLTSTAR